MTLKLIRQSQGNVPKKLLASPTVAMALLMSQKYLAMNSWVSSLMMIACTVKLLSFGSVGER